MAVASARVLPVRLLVPALLSTTLITALQLTPNSPCSSLCLNLPDADASNPSASDTRDEDIICANSGYASDKGRKFEGCMNCLQNSTFSKGSENDQAWFIYNLRYAVAHCVFDYNGTGIGSYPCVTSEACGPLQNTLTGNLANNTGSDPFGYCSFHGGSTFGDTFGKCLDCMGPDTQHGYITNFFVALEAGCEQRPTSQGRLALNDTLFANHTIGILNTDTPPTANKSGSGLPTGVIVAIVIGSIVGVALITGCAVLVVRRRRDHRRKNSSALEYAARQHMRGAGATSSMDFQCATHVNPFSPGFSNDRDGWNLGDHAAMEGKTGTAAAALHPGMEGGEKLQMHQMQPPPPQEAVRRCRRGAQPAPSNGTGPKLCRKDGQNNHHPRPAHITTSDIPKPEPAMVTSPTPYSPDDYTTPSSTTSATPFLNSGGGGGLLKSKASRQEMGSPVASSQIQTSFPPPPKR